MSANGAVVAGYILGANNAPTAYQWTNSTLVQLPGSTGLNSAATAVSPDGSVVVGQKSYGTNGDMQAFEWTNANGVVTTLIWPAGYITGSATGVSTDGTTIVGEMSAPANGGGGGGGQSNAAFIWTQASGFQDLQQVLATDDGLGSELAGWTLTEATAITPDGNTIVGVGIGPQGQEGWIAQLNPARAASTANRLPSRLPSAPIQASAVRRRVRSLSTTGLPNWAMQRSPAARRPSRSAPCR
jgi:uncharacterized membrane protein